MNEYNYDYYNQNSRLVSLNDVMPNYIPKTNYMPTNQSNNNYNNLETYSWIPFVILSIITLLHSFINSKNEFNLVEF